VPEIQENVRINCTVHMRPRCGLSIRLCQLSLKALSVVLAWGGFRPGAAVDGAVQGSTPRHAVLVLGPGVPWPAVRAGPLEARPIFGAMEAMGVPAENCSRRYAAWVLGRAEPWPGVRAGRVGLASFTAQWGQLGST